MVDMITNYRPGIVKYCYSLLLDYHEAQDAAQDVMLTAVRKAESLRDSDAIGTWLYRIAYSTCINIMRRKRLQRLFLQQEASQLGAGTHQDSYNYGISPALAAAINTLSPKDRALVYSRAVDEMEYHQLEAIYNTKAATLRKRYERARKKLLEQLTGKDEQNG